MAAASDLITLTTLKTWLSLDTSNASRDTNLALLITAISRAILTKLQRPSLLPSPYKEYRDGGDQKLIILRNWPVTSISSVTIDGQPAQKYFLEDADIAPPGKPQELALVDGACFRRGRKNILVEYVAGYQVTNEPASVPAGDLFTVAVQAPYGAWASDCGVTYDGAVPLIAVASNPSEGQYSVSGGTYTFAAADAGKAVQISYGYIPADLAMAVLEWAVDRYNYMSRVGIASKTLGGQETVSFIVKDMPDFVTSALQGYMNVVPIW